MYSIITLILAFLLVEAAPVAQPQNVQIVPQVDLTYPGSKPLDASSFAPQQSFDINSPGQDYSQQQQQSSNNEDTIESLKAQLAAQQAQLAAEQQLQASISAQSQFQGQALAQSGVYSQYPAAAPPPPFPDEGFPEAPNRRHGRRPKVRGSSQGSYGQSAPKRGGLVSGLGTVVGGLGSGLGGVVGGLGTGLGDILGGLGGTLGLKGKNKKQGVNQMQ